MFDTRGCFLKVSIARQPSLTGRVHGSRAIFLLQALAPAHGQSKSSVYTAVAVPQNKSPQHKPKKTLRHQQEIAQNLTLLSGFNIHTAWCKYISCWNRWLKIKFMLKKKVGLAGCSSGHFQWLHAGWVSFRSCMLVDFSHRLCFSFLVKTFLWLQYFLCFRKS